MNKGMTVDLEREIALAEEEFLKVRERLAVLRRQSPKEEVRDYALRGWDGAALTPIY